MSFFTPNQTVDLDSGGSCTILQFIGEGGQGEVYKVRLADKEFALKWFFQNNSLDNLKKIITKLIQNGPPTDSYGKICHQFLWPQAIATSKLYPKTFGYIMPLREPRFKDIRDLMKRRIDPTIRTLVTVCYELAHSYFNLHTKGYCYRDINFGNCMFDPNTGEIVICDNDNVTTDPNLITVYGTPGFMAPEIVRGEAPPSRSTDWFSLAVLMFYILHIHHPLHGKKEEAIHCFDLAAQKELYGINPIFIFDPQNDSNRPHPKSNAAIFWQIYPDKLKNLFIRAFGEGLHSPEKRVKESEWREAMIYLRDTIVFCQSCGKENFYDVLAKQNSCWSCKQKIILPLKLTFKHLSVALNYNTKLFPHHIDENARFDFSNPVAEIVQHPKMKNIWGLKNKSSYSWSVLLPDGTTQMVEPERSVTLQKGIQIKFANSEAVIT